MTRKFPTSPPDSSPELQRVYAQAGQSLEQCRALKRKMDTQKLIQAILIACVILGLGIGAWLFYSHRAGILAKGKELIQSVLPTPKATATTPPVTSVILFNCKNLEMTLDGTKLRVTIPELGACYEISPQYQTVWSQTFSNSDNQSAFASQIGGDQAFVEAAIQNSLSTWQLDLRSPEPVQTEVPTFTPTPSPTTTPTAIPTYANREIPLSFPDLIKVMRELGIPRLVGNENTRYNLNTWALYYTAEDYLILTVYGMPDECVNGTSVVVTLDPFEGAMSIADGWIYCK